MARSSVTYQELSDLEADLDDFNVDLLRIQAQRETALYARRAALVRRIPGFWPLVFEQAPAEVDQYIQPTDAAVLLSSLQSIDVSRFEAESGDPRSIAIKFTFAENEYFEDSVLEKRFWYRQQAPSADELKKIAAKNAAQKDKRAKSGKKLGDDEDEEIIPDNWAGLVSEPVAIKWKAGKDLTSGLLDLAVKVWQEGKPAADLTENQTALKALLDKTELGGISFFAWFGYVGRRVTAEESAAATAQDKKDRAERAAKWADKAEKFAASADAMEEDDEEEEEEDDEDDDEDDEDDEDYAFEIFQDGDTVALGLAEDVWPNAIKYFYEAQEQDTLSELDFEGDSDDEEDEEEAPPLKKQKN